MPRPILLVVDDEPAITTLIGRVGRSIGYEVREASDADAFKSDVETRGADVICMDLAMPGTDGIELLRYLARAKCRSRLVLISGMDRQVLDTALRLGQALGLEIAGTVSKPIGMVDLRTMLVELAQSAQQPKRI